MTFLCRRKQLPAHTHHKSQARQLLDTYRKHEHSHEEQLRLLQSVRSGSLLLSGKRGANVVIVGCS